MILVCIGNFSDLERLTFRNWCKFTLGDSSVDTWVFYKQISNATRPVVSKLPHEYALAFKNPEDAVAFKLTFNI